MGMGRENDGPPRSQLPTIGQLLLGRLPELNGHQGSLSPTCVSASSVEPHPHVKELPWQAGRHRAGWKGPGNRTGGLQGETRSPWGRVARGVSHERPLQRPNSLHSKGGIRRMGRG